MYYFISIYYQGTQRYQNLKENYIQNIDIPILNKILETVEFRNILKIKYYESKLYTMTL